MFVYSPKIDEELIPVLYRLAKAKDKLMTRIVDEIIRKAITKNRRKTKKE